MKHTEFLLRFTAIMLCRKQQAEIGLDSPKVMILMSKIKDASLAKKFEEEEEWEALFHEDSYHTLTKLTESLGVNHTTDSKYLKVLGIIQRQEHWSYELKTRDVDRHLFMYEQLLQRQKKKGFLHHIVTGDEK